jgi:hypothetical protein
MKETTATSGVYAVGGIDFTDLPSYLSMPALLGEQPKTRGNGE